MNLDYCFFRILTQPQGTGLWRPRSGPESVNYWIAAIVALLCTAAFGCAAPWNQPEPQPNLVAASEINQRGLPDKFEIQVGQLAIHSDFEIASSHRLLVEMQQLREEISNRLDVLPSDENIHVYLFENPTQFQAYSQRLLNPVAHRRAFFIQTDTTLSVYAAWSDQVATDLRHELTHAYLHSVVPRLPLWLDEGIAEFFEVEPGQDGWNLTHAKAMKGQSLIPLADLEPLHDPAKMTQEQYASSWLWVHFLMTHSDDTQQLLQNHIREWKDKSEAQRLSKVVSQNLPVAEDLASSTLELPR